MKLQKSSGGIDGSDEHWTSKKRNIGCSIFIGFSKSFHVKIFSAKDSQSC